MSQGSTRLELSNPAIFPHNFFHSLTSCMLAVESIPSNSYKSKSLQFMLLIVIFKWKTQPRLNDDTTTVSIKISLVYSLRHGPAEIHSLVFVMAPFFKLLCTWFGYMCCLMRSVHRVQNKAEKVHIIWQIGAFPIVLPGSFGRWSFYLLHSATTGAMGGRLGPQDCSLNICFFKVYYVSCRNDSAMLEWQPNKVFYQRNPGFWNIM